MNNDIAVVLVGGIIILCGAVTGHVLWDFLGAVLVSLGYLVITLVFLGAVEHETTYGPHQ